MDLSKSALGGILAFLLRIGTCKLDQNRALLHIYHSAGGVTCPLEVQWYVFFAMGYGYANANSFFPHQFSAGNCLHFPNDFGMILRIADLSTTLNLRVACRAVAV